MTDDQLNHLIEFLSRQKENIFLELNHVKSERDACVAERDEYKKKYEESEEELKAKIAEKERELAEKDRIIKSKNKQIEKKSKKIMDLQERLDDANENRYGDKQQRSRSKKSDDKKEHESKKDDKGQNNTRSTNNPDTDDVDRTRQEEECDGTTPQDPIIESKSDKSVKSSATGMTFKPENRPFAAMRKVIEHFGSDEGAEKMSSYLSIVSTVLMSGASVWRFFGDFFEDMITGGKKHLALLNLSIG